MMDLFTSTKVITGITVEPKYAGPNRVSLKQNGFDHMWKALFSTEGGDTFLVYNILLYFPCRQKKKMKQKMKKQKTEEKKGKEKEKGKKVNPGHFKRTAHRL